MQKRIIETDKAPSAIGPYSQAVQAGEFIFTAGQIPIDPKSVWRSRPTVHHLFVYGWIFMAAATLHAQVPADSLAASQSSLIKSPRGAMLRSAVLPGWGQLYNNQKIKAGIAFFAEAGLIGNAIALNQQVVSAVTEDERLFYESNRSLSVWLAMGIYFLAMIDSYVDASLSDFDIGPDLSMTPISDSDNNSMVTLSWSF